MEVQQRMEDLFSVFQKAASATAWCCGSVKAASSTNFTRTVLSFTELSDLRFLGESRGSGLLGSSAARCHAVNAASPHRKARISRDPCAGAQRISQRPLPGREVPRSSLASTSRDSRSQQRISSLPCPETQARSRNVPLDTALQRCAGLSDALSKSRMSSSWLAAASQRTMLPLQPVANMEPSGLKQPDSRGRWCQLPKARHCQHRTLPPSGPGLAPSTGNRSQSL
mmetsp:Transcript_56495/g.131989  ORF Transcript_56495/g.131989 Transcript_56495/m.131989 type:complete len:226 (+) Transcript_56495:625-1302(+)